MEVKDKTEMKYIYMKYKFVKNNNKRAQRQIFVK